MPIAWLFAAALAATAPATPAPAAPLQATATPTAPAQVPATLAFRHYGIAAGLPSASAYTVAQDPQGYLWIGTHDGLARYDARTFKIYRHDPANPASLPANDVSALLVDHAGRLWVGGEGTGLERLRDDGEGFEHWLHDAQDPGSLGGNDVMSLAQGPDGSIWVGVYAGGLNRLRPDARAFTHWRHDGKADSLLSDNVTALAFDASGDLWIGTDAGLERMAPGGAPTPVALPGLAKPTNVWQLRAYPDGVDAATADGLFRIELDHRGAPASITRMGNAGVTLASLRSIGGGTWIAQQGALEFLASDGTLRRYTHQTARVGSLPGSVPLGIVRDHEGGLWIALMDGGLAYLPPGRRAFSAWQQVAGDATSLGMDRVRALARADNGGLWVGGPGGALDLLDPVRGSVQHFAQVVGLGRDSISALAVDTQGRVWIGHQHGLRLFDHGHVRDIALGAGAPHGVWAILAARDGSVYVSANGGGVSRIDPRTLAVTPLGLPQHDGAAADVEHFVQARDGAIWAAGSAGLLRLAPGASAFTPVAGIAAGRIDAFAFAADGTLWAAREDALQHYSIDAAHARRIDGIDAAHGWPVVQASGLAVDAAGDVLATTPRGLVRYAPSTHNLYLFTARDGLANAAFTPGGLLHGADGMLYAGSLDGVIGILPAALSAPTLPPQAVVASISVRRDGRTVRLDPAQGPLQLRWNDRELAVSADALSFIDPATNRYRFRLRPFDTEWVDTAQRNVREFSALRAGHYTLEVEVATAAGPWSAATVPIAVDVAAPPWATAWAYVAYAVALLLLLFAVAWLVRRRQQHAHRLQLSEERQHMAEQANMAKSRFLANMAHEIRTPLTGVLGMTELLLRTPLDARQHQYADAIRHSGNLLLRQVNDALDVARIEARRLELDSAPFDPAACLREVAGADAGLAAQKHLRIDVVIGADVPRAVRGDALRVQQVLFNLTHNALKFTSQGAVSLRLDRDGEGIVYAITDNGPGMTAEECARVFQRFAQADYGRLQRGSGLGLAISHDLVALMGGRIVVQSAPGEGSTFHVHLPLASVNMPLTHAVAGTSQAATAAAPASVAPSTTDDGSARRVLLVEDDPVAGMAIAGLIETFGYRVSLAPQALAALSMIDAEGHFDVMVFDFDLPGMDGCALARLLRTRGVTVPIIALTASAHGDEAQRARDAGMTAFLRKPVLAEPLRDALEDALQHAADAPVAKPA